MSSASPAVRRQLTAAFTCNIALMTTGIMVGWAAPTLKKLRELDSPFHLTNYQQAWVVNAMYYGMMLSPFPSGFIMNNLGRRNSLLFLSLFSIISWILIYISTSASMLMVARFFAGFWMGGTQTVAPIYTAEISQPHVRGVCRTIYQVNGLLGSNIAFIVAPYVSIQTMALFGGLLSALFLVLFSLCPESPYGYIVRKKSESAEKSLSWFRERGPIQSELEVIKTSVEKEMNNNRRIANLVTVAANRKAFVIVQIISTLARLNGISCIRAFSSVILPPHLGPLTTDHCTIILGFVWMFSSVISTGFVDKVGRKSILYFSGWGIGISMLWTGVWYFLNDRRTIVVSLMNWLPLLGFAIFGLSCIGQETVTKLYQRELFPSTLRGQASALTTMNAAFSSTVSTWLFTVLEEKVGLYINFFVFAAVGFISLLFTYCYAIETKGKSPQMIRAELRGKKLEMNELIRPENGYGSRNYGTLRNGIA